ncbi:MAG: hypothetical protein IKW37_00715 [Bacteroidaceae bacterium]|nr:hypothetical protein [Bacteroidaceae bacterium]
MKEEQDILKKVGTKNPFQVPEGYFESFTQELMSKLPEKETCVPIAEPNLWTRVKPWLYMTAMFLGIMLSVRIFVGEPQKEDFPISMAEAENLSDEEWENIASNAMVHNYDFYEFLTGTEN